MFELFLLKNQPSEGIRFLFPDIIASLIGSIDVSDTI
jgi:hypothetical protein